MSALRRVRIHRPMNRPALLLTENSADYDNIFDRIRDEVDAKGAFELGLVHDMAQTRMELYRLGAAKAAAINRSYMTAIANLVQEFVRQDDEWTSDVAGDAISIAQLWFDDPITKRKLQTLLQRVGLDDSAIEEEAMTIAKVDSVRYEHLIDTLQIKLATTLRTLFAFREGMRRHRTVDGDIITDQATSRRALPA